MVTTSGVPKVLKTVLTEQVSRPDSGPRLRVHCAIKPSSGKVTPNTQCLKGGPCSARALLASQPDFKAQKGELQEAIQAAGHLVLFYPPFHCELNVIEYLWGAAKQYTCAHCEYSFPSLNGLVLETVAQIPDK